MGGAGADTTTTMFRLVVFATISACALAAPFAADPTLPHLASAWQAESTGDGLPGQTGLESYLYQPGSEKDGSMRAHKWDYGADNCIKYQVDNGFRGAWTGTFYVACDAVDCCKDGDEPVPDLKEWDIPPSKGLTKVGFGGFKDTTELNNKPVKHAEQWNQDTHIPFSKVGVNYSYYITRETNGNQTDVITHRIDYGAPKIQPGSILYGNFTVIHADKIEDFKKTFQPPPACLKNNVLTCADKKVKEWNTKYFKHAAAERGWMP